nr:MAG TPA: hypothetical protein [Caudoviricetes sp.]
MLTIVNIILLIILIVLMKWYADFWNRPKF